MDKRRFSWIGHVRPLIARSGEAARDCAAGPKRLCKHRPRTGSSVAGGGYGITVSPLDGTVWRTNTYIGQSGAADTNALAGQNKIVKFDPKSSTFTQYPLPPPGRSPIGIDAATD